MNHQSRRSLTERGLSLLCAAAMVAGVVLGNVDTPRASASEQVLVCGQNEHIHGDGCYQKQLTCSQGEHTHSDSCRNENGEIVCGQGEHAHADGCYTNVLICGQSEHKHGAECYIVRAVKSETVPETQQKSAPETQPTAENTEPQSKAETPENAVNTETQSKAETPENAGNTQPQSASDTQQSAGNTQPQSTADTQQAAGNAQEQSASGTQPTEGGSDAADTQPTEGQSDAAGTQPTEGQSNAEGTQQPTEGQSDPAGTRPTEGQSGTAGTQPTENQSDAAETQADAESEAKELKASVTTKATYAVAGKEDLVFETKVAGGAAPYTVKYAIKLDDKTVYEQNEFSEKVTYRPESYGVHTIYMEATDAVGKTSKAECSVPVAADETENADIWKQSVQSVTLTGDYAKDIAAIAKTQLGTKENKKNFIINKEGTTQYYSRYGQWYGDTYEEWSAMFASFCAAYAQIPEKYLPREKDNSKWAEKLGDRYVSKDGYTPQAGDLVFFGENPHKDGTTQLQTGTPAHVGIVIEVNEDAQTITAIEGNAGGEVSRQQYSLGEEKIAGYMSMAKVSELAKAGQGETSGETDAENDVQTETEAPEFIVVKMVLGDVAHWVMGAEGTDHSWQVLDNQEIIHIEDGSGDTAKIMPLAAGKAYLIHNYTADDEICMETFEVEVVETAEESESETADEGESGATGESETESETETETGDGTGSGKKTEYITLTTDDVILRAQPSVEADVIAVMDSGAKLELLDIVEAEDAEWYKVVYRGTGALMQQPEAVGTENAESAAQADPSASAEDSAASAGDTAQAGEAAADAAAGDAAGGSSAGGAAADSSAAANQNPGVEAYVRSDLADVFQETEPAPEVMTYEDEEVVINVTEVTEGAIPENAVLRVVPVKQDNEAYAEVAAKLLEKAEQEEYDIAGFLAYDITFVDEADENLEPNGEVKVTMVYKQAVVPEEVVAEPLALANDILPTDDNSQESDIPATEGAVSDVIVMHLQEDENGDVTQVVDMVADGSVIALETTTEQEIEKAEFVTDSFSVYTITWTVNYSTKYSIKFHYVDEAGNDITAGESDTSMKPDFGYGWYDGGNGSRIPLPIKHVAGWKYKSNYLKYNISRGSGNEEKQVNGIYGLLYDSDTISYLNKSLEQEKILAKTVDVYLVYVRDNSSGTGGNTLNPLDEPAHSKYIQYNGNDDYTLTLNVVGNRDESAGVDLLFVLDRSGSMANSYMTSLKDQVASISKMFLNNNSKNRVAAVSFSSDGYDIERDQDWTTNSDTIISKICGTKKDSSWKGGISANGGTNWQAGMIKANRMLQNSYSELQYAQNRKYVIFISDGKPTYRYWSYTEIGASNVGNQVGAGSSDDTKDGSGRNFDAAVAQYEVSTYLREATMYAIYMDNDARSAMEKFGKAVGAVNGAYDGTGSGFTQIMEAIANQILTASFTDVEISDQLSGYVELADNPQWAIQKDGEILSKDLYEFQYAPETKKFTLKIKGELEKDAVYSISCHIKPSEKAYYTYYTEGYGHNVGEEKTDAPENTTSEGQPGFDANANEGVEEGRATLSYVQKLVSTDPEIATYPHPVVQVTETSTSHTVNKVWVGEKLDTLSVTLVPTIADASAEGGYRELTAEEIVQYRFPENMSCNLFSAAQKEDQEDVWTYTWNNLPSNYYYMEGEEVKNTPIRYTVKESMSEQDSGRFTAAIEESEDGQTTTITNTVNGELTVTKVWNDYGEQIDHSQDSIYVGLFKRNETTGQLDFVAGSVRPLDKEGGWTTIYQHLGVVAGYQAKELIKLVGGKDGALAEIKDGVTSYYEPVENGGIVAAGGAYYEVSSVTSQDESDNYKATTTITNKLLRELTISKKWADFDNKYESRSQTVTLQLKRKMLGSADWSFYGDPVTLDQNRADPNNGNVWSYTYTNLSRDYEYQIEEVGVSAGYTESPCETDAAGNLSITNTLNWQLVKRSASEQHPVLEGAEFELKDSNEDGHTYTGVSDTNGVVTWTENGTPVTVIADGEYTLTETKAPAGYTVGKTVEIIVTDGLPAFGTAENVSTGFNETKKKYELYYDDEVLYSLPSAGSRGIYWYLIGGMLLMMAASLILYKTRCKEVLKS